MLIIIIPVIMLLIKYYEYLNITMIVSMIIIFKLLAPRKLTIKRLNYEIKMLESFDWLNYSETLVGQKLQE